MIRRSLILALVGLSVPALAAAVACTTSSATGESEDGATPSPDSGGGDAGLSEASVDAGAEASGEGGPLAVTPASANVLTCGKLQLAETGGAGGGAWTVSPSTGAGTVSATGGYAAPLVAPSSPAVTVAYAVGSASASAQLQVATAFLGTKAPVPIDAGTDNPRNSPFEHQLTASGTHVYVGLGATTASTSNTPLEADIYASSDNGKTFTGPTAYHTGDLVCATIAVDSGNPSVVYLAYLAGHGDSTSNTGQTLRLAVSTDGAKTFPVEYDVADSANSIVSLICPDVTSPSPGHVIVAGVVQDNSSAHVATFVSSSQGAGIGPVSQEGVATAANVDGGTYSSSDTNGGASTACFIYSNGSAGSPRIFSNGAGAACVVFQYSTINGCTAPNNVAVQCSQDSGGTWTSPVALGYPTANAPFYPTGSVSPGGKVAITWLNTLASDAGSTIASFVTISKDGGKTFATPVQYPAAAALAMGGTTLPVVAWENDTVLWLAQTGSVGNAPNLYVDKTCDDGASWSGGVKVGGYLGTSLFLTSAGMVAAGDTTASGSGASVTTIPLAAQ